MRTEHWPHHGRVSGRRVLLAALTSDPAAHRYQHTVRVCALQEDLSSLPYGDLTEVSGAGSAPRRHRSSAPGPRAARLHPHPTPRGQIGARARGKVRSPAPSNLPPPPVSDSHLGLRSGGITAEVAPTTPVLGPAWPPRDHFPSAFRPGKVSGPRCLPASEDEGRGAGLWLVREPLSASVGPGVPGPLQTPPWMLVPLLPAMPPSEAALLNL